MKQIHCIQDTLWQYSLAVSIQQENDHCVRPTGQIHGSLAKGGIHFLHFHVISQLIRDHRQQILQGDTEAQKDPESVQSDGVCTQLIQPPASGPNSSELLDL